MIEIKIATVLMCMICKTCGEIFNHNFQRFIMPIILGISVSLIAGWFIPIHLTIPFFTINFLFIHLHSINFILPLPRILLVLPMIAPLCLGYKDYGSNDAVARAVWLFVICLVAWLGQAITGHLSWFIYLPYLFVSGWVGTLDRNINNLIGAPLNGFIIGLPILFIH